MALETFGVAIRPRVASHVNLKKAPKVVCRCVGRVEGSARINARRRSQEVAQDLKAGPDDAADEA